MSQPNAFLILGDHPFLNYIFFLGQTRLFNTGGNYNPNLTLRVYWLHILYKIIYYIYIYRVFLGCIYYLYNIIQLYIYIEFVYMLFILYIIYIYKHMGLFRTWQKTSQFGWCYPASVQWRVCVRFFQLTGKPSCWYVWCR